MDLFNENELGCQALNDKKQNNKKHHKPNPYKLSYKYLKSAEAVQ